MNVQVKRVPASDGGEPTPAPSAAGGSRDPQAREPVLRGPFGARAIRLGRVYGIDVGLDWSWIFIFLLITLSLSQWFLQGDQPLGPTQAWVAAVLASLLFFASILLHEFGHSLTAQALGLRVRSITLFLFGGLARLSGEPKTARDEFLIAAAGPVVSVALGLLFWAIAALVPSSAEDPNILAVSFGWLGTINLVLAVFNLVPGFPLDGGRLLRAAVWHVTGDYEKATLTAAAIGSAFAYLLIAGGIFMALVWGAFLNGLWFAFIGWFLLSAAQGSSLQMILQRELGGIRLSEAMEPIHPVVNGETTVASVLEHLILAKGGRYFFVEEGGEIVGLVTLHQIKQTPLEERTETTVRSIMLDQSRLVTVPVESTLWQAFERMSEVGIGQIPVEHEGRMVGMLTRERMVRIIHNVRELRAG